MATSTPTYYSFERLEGDGFDGLLRFDGEALEKAVDGAWIADEDLLERVLFPGADGPERIDEATAGELADRYGVEL